MNVLEVKLLFQIPISQTFNHGLCSVTPNQGAQPLEKCHFLSIFDITIGTDLRCPRFSYRALIQIAGNNADNGIGDGNRVPQAPMYCVH